MGVVWMAEQAQPVRRKVVLKVIEPGAGHPAPANPRSKS